MPELSHDTADDGFHEIQLSGKQLVFPFMATTVVAVVIFICGVLVGRDVRPAGPEAVAQAAALETAPPPAQLSEPAPIAEDTPTPAADDVAANTSYEGRLESDKPVTETLPVQKKAEPAPALSVPEPAPEPVRAEPPAPKAAAPAKAEPAPAPEPSSAPAATAPAPAGSGQWIVQVAALRDRSAAASIVRRLSGKGYPAFVVSPARSASTRVYKVQVGRYEERRDAEQVARRLKTEEKLSSWISR